MSVVVIGTLDTKGPEIAYVRDLLNQAGVDTWVIDCGSLGEPTFRPETVAEQVYSAGGQRLSAIRAANDRGLAVATATKGVEKLVADLHRSGKVTGILGLGGSAGTTIATAAMRALPFGLPKLMVSTLASGQVQPFVGVRDICMLHSVTDFCGLNRFSRQVLSNAAAAMAGMVRNGKAPAVGTDRPLVTATMFGVTTPCVQQARARLEDSGREVLVFHATGTGGRTMEAMIADGLISGVLDITTTELADELVGGVLSAGPNRLTAASIRGVPQVISVGALDMVNFGPRDTVPARFEGRRFHQHNTNVTLMRTTPEENDRLGQQIVEKACASRGPVTILLPLRGISAIDVEGGPFWWPEADQALFQSIRNWVAPPVKVVELDLHINDPEFARTAADLLLSMI